jgi:hypothetical protein
VVVSNPYFPVAVREEFGGAPCAFEDGYKEWRDCNPRACAVDCQGYWDEWRECSKPCGGGPVQAEFSRLYRLKAACFQPLQLKM